MKAIAFLMLGLALALKQVEIENSHCTMIQPGDKQNQVVIIHFEDQKKSKVMGHSQRRQLEAISRDRLKDFIQRSVCYDVEENDFKKFLDYYPEA